MDELEKTILDGTHDEYRERMAHAEKKRLTEMKNAKLMRDLEETDIRFTFEAFKKAAYDHFYVKYNIEYIYLSIYLIYLIAYLLNSILFILLLFSNVKRKYVNE